jgi:4-amino-4-deoxychorismate lyase
MKFIETILVTKSNIINKNLHLKRIQKTLLHYKFPLIHKFDLNFQNKRVRITYSQKGIEKIEYFPIKKREFKKFKIVNIDFCYKFKFANRKNFEKIYNAFPKFDEYILVKNNLVTDSTISNLAFFTGKEWLTPKYPLLKGTKREELIKKGALKEENIHIYDLKYFKKIALINAILGFYQIDSYTIN